MAEPMSVEETGGEGGMPPDEPRQERQAPPLGGQDGAPAVRKPRWEAELAASWEAVFSGAPPPPPDPVARESAEGLAGLLAREWPVNEVYRWFVAIGRVPRAEDWERAKGLPSPQEITAMFGSFDGLIKASKIEEQGLARNLPRLRAALLQQRDANLTRERELGARALELAAQAERLEHRQRSIRSELEAENAQQIRDLQRDSRQKVETAARAVQDANAGRQAAESALRAARQEVADASQQRELAGRERQLAVRRAHALAHRLAQRTPASPVFAAWFQFPAESFETLCMAAAGGLAGGSLAERIRWAPAGITTLPAADGLVEVHREPRGPLRKLTLLHSEPLLAEQDQESDELLMSAQRRLRITIWREPRQAGVLSEVSMIDAPPLLPVTELGRISDRLLERATPLSDAGWPLGRRATRAAPEDVAELMSFLCNPDRTRPVLVLGGQPQDSETGLDVDQLAVALCGAAHVVTLDTPATLELTDLVGQKLSVWAGKARCYRPGFSGSSPARHHPRLDPRQFADQQQLLNALMLLAMTAAGSSESLESARSLVAAADGDPSEDTLELLRRRERELAEQRSISTELSQLLASGNAAEQGSRVQVSTVAEATALAHQRAQHLKFSPKAFTAAAMSFYRPAQNVYDALMALNQIAGEYIAGRIGTSVGQRVQQQGLTWRGNVSNFARSKYAADYECPYEDMRLPLAPHIVVSNGRGEDRTCRIYLYLCDGSAELERGIYVGHVGRHLPE